MEKTLTIIVPAYNMEKYLNKDINSLIVSDSMMEQLEILIINDGSKDRTSEIGYMFQNKYPNTLRVIDKENGHYGSCINCGLQEAKGTFVKILDADDCFLTENFEKLIKELGNSEKMRENVDLFFCDWRKVDENDEVLEEMSFDIPQDKVIEIDSMEDEKYFRCIQHHSIIYRTSFLRSINYRQSEKVAYSDTEWAFIPLLYVNRIKYLPIQVYSYLFGRADQSMNPVQKKKGFRSMIVIENSLLDTYISALDKVDELHLHIYRERFAGNVKYLYRNYLVSYSSDESIVEIERFDKRLKNEAVDVYQAVQDDTVGKLNFHYVRAFRKNPRGLRFKAIRCFYDFRSRNVK